MRAEKAGCYAPGDPSQLFVDSPVLTIPPAVIDLDLYLTGPGCPDDTTPPTTSANPTPSPNGNGWNNTDVVVTLNATDDAGGSGVKHINFTLSGAQAGAGPVAGSSASVTISTEGVTTLTFFATDNAGNQETLKTLTVRIDKTPPTLVFGAPSPLPNGAGWNRTDVSFGFTASDNLSGVASTSATSPVIITGSGSGLSSSVRVTDQAGNTALFATPPVNIDRTPPNFPIASVSPPPNANGWNNSSPVTVSFTGNGDMGALQSGGVTCTGPTTLTAETAGTVVSGTCTDAAGNTSAATSVTVKIDRTPPRLTCSVSPKILWPPNEKLVPVTASVTVTDALSGQAGFTLVSVTSNGPNDRRERRDRDHDVQGFVIGTPDTSGLLRAERLENEGTRIYTLTYRALDLVGNAATCNVTVTVPHDQREHDPKEDDAPDHEHQKDNPREQEHQRDSSRE